MADTFVRTDEFIDVRGPEFAFDASVRRIPPERMRMKTMHIVPRSTQALEVRGMLRLVPGQGPLLFAGERDQEKPISDNTILGALQRVGRVGA